MEGKTKNLYYQHPCDLVTFFEAGMARPLPFFRGRYAGVSYNLGAGRKDIGDAINLSYEDGWNGEVDPIPAADGSVSTIYAFHFLEHLSHPVGVLLEAHRVLCKGGAMNIVVPYYRSQMAFQDLDHKSFYCEDTWKELFSNPYYDTTKGENFEWQFDIGLNIIIGLKERNLALLTQLIRR